MDPFVRRMIAKYAPTFGLDPYAVEAVSRAESGGRRYARGDLMGGRHTSFGPFQLHEGGALPKGRGLEWAGSEAGIKYALSQMESHARGLKGNKAIDAIVRKFERPADPNSEIRRAITYYKKQGSMPVFSTGGSDPASPRVDGAAAGQQAAQTMDRRQALLAWVMANNAMGKTSSPLPFLALASQMAPGGSESSSQAPADPQGAATLPYKAKTAGRSFSGSLNELFYDPLGAIDEGKNIPAIGGHSDHVHIALRDPNAMQLARQKAKAFGLTIREDGVSDRVDPVHTKGSFHYQKYNNKSNLRRGADISGRPADMAAFYKWAARTFR